MNASALHLRHAPWSDVWFDDILAIEQSAYSHPWTPGNFKDSISAGYHMEVLLEDDGEREHVVGYLVVKDWALGC